MLLSEQTLKNFVDKMLFDLQIPRPKNLTIEEDIAFKKHFIKVSFKALNEIEEVDTCYGFDLSKVMEA